MFQQQPRPDQLNTQALLDALGDIAPSFFVQTHAILDSTNTEAKRMVANGMGRLALIVAETQTAGRGRMGRSFFSPGGTGVYFSLLVPLSQSLEGAVTVTSAAAVAVMRAIRSLTGLQTDIKWVNDLYWNGKKVCGILAETVSDFHNGDRTDLILGIGINLNTAVFPQELSGIAGSLACSAVSRADLIAEVVRELFPYLRNPADRTWLADYRAFSCVLGKSITWVKNGESFLGTAVGINEKGALLVQDADGNEVVLDTGEISVSVR